MLGTYDLAAAAKSSGFNPQTLILILIVVVAFYFLMIRPQQRRKQAAAQKSNNVEPGARVRTTAGMYATVVDVDGDDDDVAVLIDAQDRRGAVGRKSAREELAQYAAAWILGQGGAAPSKFGG